MKRQWIKWTLVASGAVVFLLLTAFLLFAYYFAGTNKTLLVRQSVSPDGQFVAEIREIITPMHGGPDQIQVSVGPAEQAVGDVIYSQEFECQSDTSAFQLKWTAARILDVSYGACDSGRYKTASDNKVLQESASWHEVHIDYASSEHVAHAKPD